LTYGSQLQPLVFIATQGSLYAISPEDPAAFRRAYQRYAEMGSLTPLAPRSIYPTFLVSRVWNERPARYLLLAGLALSLVLLVWVSLVAPGYGQISLGFNPDGSLREAVPAVQLLLLPLVNAFFFLTDLILGLFFYRRGDQQLPTIALPSGLSVPLGWLWRTCCGQRRTHPTAFSCRASFTSCKSNDLSTAFHGLSTEIQHLSTILSRPLYDPVDDHRSPPGRGGRRAGLAGGAEPQRGHRCGGQRRADLRPGRSAWRRCCCFSFPSSALSPRFPSRKAALTESSPKARSGLSRGACQRRAGGSTGPPACAAPGSAGPGPPSQAHGRRQRRHLGDGLGVLSRSEPRRSPPDGLSNGALRGVTLFGYLAVVAGSLLIGLTAGALSPSPEIPALLLSALLGGLAGSTFDSYLGATLQAIYCCPSCDKETERHPLHTCGTETVLARGWPWMNNDLVNFACSAVGSAVGVLVWTMAI
jgi:hypothetical protein